MKADPIRQLRLIDLQDLDTRLDQIAHRTTNLPESREHDQLAADLEALDARLVDVRTRGGDVQREITKAEADVQLVRDRAARNRARLEEGRGPAKELQALQHELESLARRQGELEDTQLEVMERAEALEAESARLEEERTGLATRVAAAADERDRVLGELEQEAAGLRGRRVDLLEDVGADLVALYEKIRAQSGTGAAALVARRCGGCHLELVGADVARFSVAPEDEVLRCEECRRILVRTAESGL